MKNDAKEKYHQYSLMNKTNNSKYKVKKNKLIL